MFSVITVIVYNLLYMLMWVGNGVLKIGTFFCVYLISICLTLSSVPSFVVGLSKVAVLFTEPNVKLYFLISSNNSFLYRSVLKCDGWLMGWAYTCFCYKLSRFRA